MNGVIIVVATKIINFLLPQFRFDLFSHFPHKIQLFGPSWGHPFEASSVSFPFLPCFSLVCLVSLGFPCFPLVSILPCFSLFFLVFLGFPCFPLFSIIFLFVLFLFYSVLLFFFSFLTSFFFFLFSTALTWPRTALARIAPPPDRAFFFPLPPQFLFFLPSLGCILVEFSGPPGLHTTKNGKQTENM